MLSFKEPAEYLGSPANEITVVAVEAAGTVSAHIQRLGCYSLLSNSVLSTPPFRDQGYVCTCTIRGTRDPAGAAGVQESAAWSAPDTLYRSPGPYPIWIWGIVRFSQIWQAFQAGIDCTYNPYIADSMRSAYK